MKIYPTLTLILAAFISGSAAADAFKQKGYFKDSKRNRIVSVELFKTCGINL